jgi:hypothetical protein
MSALGGRVLRLVLPPSPVPHLSRRCLRLARYKMTWQAGVGFLPYNLRATAASSRPPLDLGRPPHITGAPASVIRAAPSGAIKRGREHSTRDGDEAEEADGTGHVRRRTGSPQATAEAR